MYPSKNTYSDNDNLIWDLQTGSHYVDWSKSYLKFTVNVKDAGNKNYTFNGGSAFNFIRDVIVTSRSGVEVDRCNNVNLLRHHLDAYHNTNEWYACEGALIGYKITPTATDYATNNTYTFLLPMNKICGIFDTPGVLMPSYLASGLRIEIQTDNIANAIEYDAASATPLVEFTNLSIVCDSFQLTESAQRQMSKISSTNGLEFPFHTWAHSPFTVAAANAFLEVRKSVSRALKAIAVCRQSTELNDELKDGFKAETFAVSKSQWRVGSQYFPQNPTDGAEEHFHQALYTLERLNGKMQTVQASEYEARYGILSCTVERSHIIADASLPLNNSRSMGLDITFTGSSTRQVDVFLKYLKLARLFISNVVIKE
jgi:hypothetical protein